MNRIIYKIESFLKSLNLQEKLLALYIIALGNMDYAAFLFQGKRVMYADVVFVFLFFAVILNVKRENDWRLIAKLILPFSLLLVFFIPSFYNSISIAASLSELGALAYLVTLGASVAYVLIKANKKFNVFLYLWVFTASFVALIGLAAFAAALVDKNLVYGNTLLFYSKIESMAHHFPRIDSLYENANMFLTYLHTSIVFAIVLFLSGLSPKRKKLILICIFIMLIAAFFTGSRRFTGLLLSLFLILHWIKGNKKVFLAKYFIFISFVLFLAISIITSIWVVFPIKILKDKNAKYVGLSIDHTYSLHFLQPTVSINIFKKHPLLGCGLGTYNKNFKDNVDWKWLESSFGFESYPDYAPQVSNRTLNFDPHSVYLGTLAETGLIGFVGLLYFIIRYISMLVSNLKPGASFDGAKMIAGCILAGFIGFILNGVIIDILTMRHFWFMIAVGTSVALNTRRLNA